MSNSDELLDKAAEALDNQGWCRGDLVNDRGEHCALGAIGYARWGTDYDQLVRYGRNRAIFSSHYTQYPDGYSVLRDDPIAAEAVNKLANQIRMEHNMAPVPMGTPSWSSEDDRSVVMNHNDRNHHLDKEGLKAKLRRGINKLRKQEAPVVPAIKQPRIEHIKIDPTTIVEQEQEKVT